MCADAFDVELVQDRFNRAPALESSDVPERRVLTQKPDAAERTGSEATGFDYRGITGVAS